MFYAVKGLTLYLSNSWLINILCNLFVVHVQAIGARHVARDLVAKSAGPDQTDLNINYLPMTDTF